MSSEQRTRPAFADHGQLGQLHEQTRNAMGLFGYTWEQPGEIYTSHNNLRYAESGVHHSIALTPRQVRSINPGAAEVLGVERGLIIDYSDPFYSDPGGTLTADFEWQPSSGGPQYHPPTTSYRIDRSPKSGLDSIMLTVQAYERPGHTEYRSCREEFINRQLFRGSMPASAASHYEVPDATELRALLGTDKMIEAEYQALALIVGGLGRLWRIRMPEHVRSATVKSVPVQPWMHWLKLA